MSPLKVILIILLGLLLLSCAAVESESEKGFWIDAKPFRGTIPANKNNKRPYWQCVGNNLTNILDCNRK